MSVCECVCVCVCVSVWGKEREKRKCDSRCGCVSHHQIMPFHFITSHPTPPAHTHTHTHTHKILHREMGNRLYAYITKPHEYSARVHDPHVYHAGSQDLMCRWLYPNVPETNSLQAGERTTYR